jgi:creatinine amidohydrolase
MSARRGKAPRQIDELTSPEFKKEAKRNPLVILPFGSTEEHGSHLPLSTDSLQAEEIVRRIAIKFDALVCPPIRYGECKATRNFPGTLSLRFETVFSITFDILTELRRNGIKRAMVLTGHAGSGHVAALRLGALRAVEQHPDLKVMVLSDYDIAYELRGKEFPESDGHAGQIETSRVLNIRPDLVGPERPVGNTRPPKFMIVADPEKYLPTGVMGDPRGANAGKGARIDDYVVKELCRLIEENFSISRKKRG